MRWCSGKRSLSLAITLFKCLCVCACVSVKRSSWLAQMLPYKHSSSLLAYVCVYVCVCVYGWSVWASNLRRFGFCLLANRFVEALSTLCFGRFLMWPEQKEKRTTILSPVAAAHSVCCCTVSGYSRRTRQAGKIRRILLQTHNVERAGHKP